MSGGARFATEIKMGRSGHEFRNRRWAEPLREYSISFSSRTMDKVLEMLTFAYRTAGSWLGFRMKDWVDFKSCPPNQDAQATDQSLGTGDGSTFYFRMNKRYGPEYTRRIYKPVDGTILVAVNGAVQDTNDYLVDYVNGVIVFDTTPPNNAVLTWGGEFDVPVRFQDDIFEALTHYHAFGQSGNVGLREIRIKEDIDEAAYTAWRNG